MNLIHRPRRNRLNTSIRGLVRETELATSHLILPMFVHAGANDQDIVSMPGVKRWSVQGLIAEAKSVHALGIPAIVLFPAIDTSLKTKQCEEAWNSQGLIPQLIAQLKQEIPSLLVITDVALDPYNIDGHDGLADDSGYILNDETVEVLCRQALCHAQAGADVISPSDMMDGRVAAIRQTLDSAGFQNVSIMSYTAKYASAYYGPFRGALDSAPKFGDKKTYQMDPANTREAEREALIDEAEGADILMVKPALPYLDVIQRLEQCSQLPIAAYHVSGEFLMVKAAAASGWLDEKKIVLEQLISIRRAGANMILTYFAKDVAQWLREDG